VPFPMPINVRKYDKTFIKDVKEDFSNKNVIDDVY